MSDEVGDFAVALGEVLAQFGKRVVDKPGQLRGALADTLGASAASHKAQVDAVVVASETGVAQQIRDRDPHVAASRDEVREWFDQLIAAGVALRDAAIVTTSWAKAFHAEGTARVASEVSQQLLVGEADATPSGGVVSSTPSEAPPPPPVVVAVPLEEAATDLGDLSRIADGGDRTRLGGDADRTDLAGLAVVSAIPPMPPPPPPAPTTYSPQGPDAAAAEVPTSPPPSDGAGGSAGDGAKDLPTWLKAAMFIPAIIAIVAMVLSLTSGQAAIAANEVETPPTAPLSDAELSAPLAVSDEEVDASGLLTKAEVKGLILTEKQLRTIVLKDAKDSPWSGQWTDKLPTLLQKITKKGCTNTLKYGVKGEWHYASSGWSGSKVGEWIRVHSIGAWYSTSKEASAAFAKLRNTGSCGTVRMTESGTTNSWTMRVSQSAANRDSFKVVRTTVTDPSGDPYLFSRSCYLRANSIVCHTVAGYQAGRVTSSWRSGSGKAKALDKVAARPVTASAFEVMK